MIDKKGNAIASIVIFAVGILIGSVIYGQLSLLASSMPLTKEALTSINNTNLQTWTAFTLLPIGVIIMTLMFLLGFIYAMNK